MDAIRVPTTTGTGTAIEITTSKAREAGFKTADLKQAGGLIATSTVADADADGVTTPAEVRAALQSGTIDSDAYLAYYGLTLETLTDARDQLRVAQANLERLPLKISQQRREAYAAGVEHSSYESQTPGEVTNAWNAVERMIAWLKVWQPRA